MAIREGDTFHAPLPPNNQPHLFVVISDPRQDDSRVVLVPLMTIDGDDETQDLSCCLKVGDHPFVQHPTYVNFRCAARPSAETILERAKRGKPVSTELLVRIREAAGKSDFLPLECRDILERQGLVDPE